MAKSFQMGKWVRTAVGVALLLYIGYFFFSLATGPKRMKEVCAQIKPGMKFAELESVGEAHGLTPARTSSGTTYMAEERSFGRFTCQVILNGGVVISSTYAHFD